MQLTTCRCLQAVVDTPLVSPQVHTPCQVILLNLSCAKCACCAPYERRFGDVSMGRIPLIFFVLGKFGRFGSPTNNMKKEREIDLVSDSSCKKACLRNAMSKGKPSWDFRSLKNSQSRGYAALTPTANCPSNVLWKENFGARIKWCSANGTYTWIFWICKISAFW